MLILAGHCNTFVSQSGEVIKVAKKISFASMTEDDFADLWQLVVRAICDKIIPGLNDETFEQEIASIVGIAPFKALE